MSFHGNAEEWPDQICPYCDSFAYAVDGGAGRYWWRCESCHYETEVVWFEELGNCWRRMIRGETAPNYYDPSSPDLED